MKPGRLSVGMLAVFLCAAPAARAAQVPPQLREFVLLEIEVRRQFAAKNYEKAGEACRKMITLFPTQPGPHYNLACALARLGKKDEALAELEAAAQRGYNQADHMEKDDDLASLREDKRFTECIQKVREKAHTGGSAYESGAAIEGVKTLEADPEAGFRYRLRMSPAASAAKPHRLVVWLHPSGGSANGSVEPWSRRLSALGYALLVFTQKEWRFWSQPDVKRLLEGTLLDVAKTPGIDAERPILMGFSAGGQFAITLWAIDPGKYGGLVLDAAYPVRPKMGGGFDPLSLPENIGIQQTPFFVLVGDQDPLAPTWRQAEPAWRQVGVPLTITYVHDKGHGWLFTDKELNDLSGWLTQVRAGKLPSGSPTPEPKAKQPPKAK